MKILMQIRVDAYTNAGGQVGDVEMMTQSAKALRELGHEVDTTADPNPPLQGYDICHLYNATLAHELVHRVNRARAFGIPVVLTPFWLDYSELNRLGRHGLEKWLYTIFPAKDASERVKALLRLKNGAIRGGTLAVLRNGFFGAVRQALDAIAVLIPNSPSEGEEVRKIFGVQRPTQVAWCGVSPPPKVGPELFRKTYGEGEFLFCVGSLQARKNQLSLLKALEGTDIPVVISGNAVKGQETYIQEVKQLAATCGATVTTLKERELLFSAYAACKVHALVSWVETTGLVSLEAAQMGARTVTTDRGFTRDYFQEDAWYCDPGNLDSIRSACLSAWNDPAPELKSDRLKSRIAEEFTWANCARQTEQAYQLALGGRA